MKGFWEHVIPKDQKKKRVGGNESCPSERLDDTSRVAMRLTTA